MSFLLNGGKKMKMYYEKDVDLNILKNKTVAVIGYGSQGMAQSRNMHESGLNVVVGLRKDGKSWNQAKKDGLTVMTVEEASEVADVIHILIPDEIQGQVYNESIKNHLKEGNTLSFSWIQYSFRYINPPENVNITMIAPKGPGAMVRKTYEEVFGIPGLVAVERDYTGDATQIALAMGQGSGLTRAGVLRQLSKKKPKQTFLVNKLYYVVELLNLSPQVSKPLLKQDINQKLHILKHATS